MKSSWITQWVLNPRTILITERRYTHRKEGHVRAKTETRVMKPQAKECLLRATGSRKRQVRILS